MKTALFSLLFATIALAGTTSIPVEFEIIEGQGHCKKICDTRGGEEVCRHKIYFDDRTFQEVQSFQENGFSNKWFERSPKELCESGALPLEGNGEGRLRVMLYKMDRSVLNSEF